MMQLLRRSFLLMPFALAVAGTDALSQQRSLVNPAEVLAAINALRRESGVPPVRLDPTLGNAARAHANAMAQANQLGHDVGGDLRTRLQAYGIGRVAQVENVAWGVNNVAEAMALWRSSSLHSQNLVAADVSRMGVGVAQGPTGLYWALIMTGGR